MVNEVSIPEETVIEKIYMIRGKKVMLDRDLAKLYGVQTKRLKEQVRRNIDRFPEDFMFELSKEELENWRSQFATSNKEIMGLRIPPFAFSEFGVLMLSNVLNSKNAIKISIQIIRVFTRMREMLLTHKDLLLKIEQFEKRMDNQDKSIKQLFYYLKQLIQDKENPPRNPIGFKPAET